MDRKNIGPEAVALACDTINKCKADTATARRILAQAHAWVCDPAIDPTWKPEAVAVPVQTAGMVGAELHAAVRADVDRLTAECADLTAKLVKLGALVTSKDAEIQTLEATIRQHSDTIALLSRDLASAKSGQPTVAKVETIGVAPQAAPVVKPAPVVPAVVSVPPAPRAVTVAATLPEGTDPYADLPPNLREWAKKRDAANRPSNLEID